MGTTIDNIFLARSLASSGLIPEVLFENGLPRIQSMDTGLEVMLRRTTDAEFRLPLDYDDDHLAEVAVPDRQAAIA